MLLSHSSFPIYVSFFISLLLVNITSFWDLGFFQPHWVFITALFWEIYFPHRFGLFKVWLVGLLLDVMLGYPMGVNAFAMSVTTAIALTVAPRFKIYGPVLQTWMVFLLVAVCQLLTFWVKNIFSAPQSGLSSLWAAFTSALVWPLLYFYLRFVTRVFHTI
jgi:rod shape-determining protein MreD